MTDTKSEQSEWCVITVDASNVRLQAYRDGMKEGYERAKFDQFGLFIIGAIGWMFAVCVAWVGR